MAAPSSRQVGSSPWRTAPVVLAQGVAQPPGELRVVADQIGRAPRPQAEQHRAR